jgi:ribosome-associated heat shock protein Hsp15
MKKEMRADKYLHCVRVFKTRELAMQACEKSQVEVEGVRVKASRELRLGEVLKVRRGALLLILKVMGFPKQRVGANVLGEYLENLTPEENYLAAREVREQERLTRIYPHEKTFNPTKKQMRDLRDFLEQQEN